MDKTDDYILIKKYYGEKMAQFCCRYGHFSRILEKPGELFELIDSKFAHNKFLYEDLANHQYEGEFVNFILTGYNAKHNIVEPKKEVTDSVQELFKKAGYTLYECHSEKDIQSFRHFYYRGKNANELDEYEEGKTPASYKGEELCTFNGDRLNRCHVFFAVKDNADELKREDFIAPKREDDYGTSVISIQFTKGKNNTLSIKNRYNHTVFNPDATFGNNLDMIIPGLTKAFEKEYGLNIISNKSNGFHLEQFEKYVLAGDGKQYKYNYEENNIYYCPDNIILVNFTPKQYDKSRYLVLDKYIIDKQKRTISLSPHPMETDSFIDSIGKIETIEDKPNNTLVINRDIIIKYNKCNQIISYSNHHVTKIGDWFLSWESAVESIDLPNVTEIKDQFMAYNDSLEEINLPKAKVIGRNFLECNSKIKKIDFPEVETIGDYFLYDGFVEEVNLPKVKKISSNFMASAHVRRLELPEVITISSNFMQMDEYLETFIAPKLETVGNCFLQANDTITEIQAPSLYKVYSNFLENSQIVDASFPELCEVGDNFMTYNSYIETINLPKVWNVGVNFLCNASRLEEINMPRLTYAGESFLEDAKQLKELDLPSIAEIGKFGLRGAEKLKKFNAPNLTTVRTGFMLDVKQNVEVNMPRIDNYSYQFLDEHIKHLIENQKKK